MPAYIWMESQSLDPPVRPVCPISPFWPVEPLAPASSHNASHCLTLHPHFCASFRWHAMPTCILMESQSLIPPVRPVCPEAPVSPVEPLAPASTHKASQSVTCLLSLMRS